ncbi:MAG: ABC transporter permease [Methanolinea sp.]|jgi:osmoprotectant transport system permease protein|nr:ABC transporter permease [Methanolinea sp.]
MTALPAAILVHITLAFSGLALAVAVGIPLAALSLRSRTAGAIISTLTAIGQAIPVFALVAFMVPLVGIGFAPSVLVIFISTLLPIVRNTYAGISSVDPDITDAAAGIGLRWSETLTKVRVPLSLHAIFSGVKFSSIIANGVAIVTVFIGSGGLGVIVLRGLARFYVPEILLGILPAIAITLLSDYCLSRLEDRLTPLPLKERGPVFRPHSFSLPSR